MSVGIQTDDAVVQPFDKGPPASFTFVPEGF